MTKIKIDFFGIKKKWLVVFTLAIFILSTTTICIFWLARDNTPVTKQTLKKQGTAFFVSVPISAFSSSQLPLLSARIGSQTFLALLDLGFTGAASVTSELLEQIPEKSFVKTRSMYTILGKEYQKNVYRISKININRMTFHLPALEEESEEMRLDSKIVHEGNEPLFSDSGKVGWELFRDTNLFLDLGNSKVAFCDSIETLKNQGYPIDTFVKVPLLLDRGLIEFEVITANGPIRGSLDTGCTWNIWNTENKEGRSFKELILDPENILKFDTFQIGDTNFGPISFHRFPIKIPIHLEATLGMEFFRTHLVFIDFWNNFIYIAPLKEDTSESQTK